MLLTSNYGVCKGDLNELLVGTEQPAVLEIKYTQSTALFILRLFTILFASSFYSLFLFTNDAGLASREFVGVTLAVGLMLFVNTLHVVTRVDSRRRMVLQGYSFFGRMRLGLGKKRIKDTDTVQIRVKTTDGNYRHNPMHELFVRRGGFRFNIMMAHYSCGTTDRVEFLERLGRAIAGLLGIEYVGYCSARSAFEEEYSPS